MKKIAKIFSISIIAVMGTVAGAHAEIASADYVDKIVSRLVIPTKTSDLQNDSNFVTTTQLNTRELISNKVKSADMAANLQSEDKYPSMKTSSAIANSAATTAVNNISVSGASATAGKVMTSLTNNNGTITATMDYVKIPVGSPTSPTGVATIWVE